MSGMANEAVEPRPMPRVFTEDEAERITAVLRQLQRGMRCTQDQRTQLDAAVWAVRTVTALQQQHQRLRLVVDELGAYDQLAGEADQLLATARAQGGSVGRRMRAEALVKATLAGAAAMAAMVQQGRESTAAATKYADTLADLMARGDG